MKKVVVFHSYYGCESYCCGHTIEIYDENDKRLTSTFAFSHKGSRETDLEFAKYLVENEVGKTHTSDLDWDNAEIETDCTEGWGGHA